MVGLFVTPVNKILDFFGYMSQKVQREFVPILCVEVKLVVSQPSPEMLKHRFSPRH